jgi:hypothetical protein
VRCTKVKAANKYLQPSKEPQADGPLQRRHCSSTHCSKLLNSLEAPAGAVVSGSLAGVVFVYMTTRSNNRSNYS